MSSFDFKKAYKDLYLPKQVPQIIDVPEMTFAMIEGYGNPNEEGGAYQSAVGALYAIAYTIKMSKKGKEVPDGYFDYVVPPLEGFWWMAGMENKNYIDYNTKEAFHWLSMIRQPDFVTEEVFNWAIEIAKKKKPDLPYEKLQLKKVNEGRCVQIMHIGTFDDEPATRAKMDAFMEENGLECAIGDQRADGSIRLHHEIYLSDPRKSAPDKQKTVIRHPIR